MTVPFFSFAVTALIAPELACPADIQTICGLSILGEDMFTLGGYKYPLPVAVNDTPFTAFEMELTETVAVAPDPYGSKFTPEITPVKGSELEKVG